MSNPEMNNNLTNDLSKAFFDEKEAREKVSEEKKKKKSNIEFIVSVIAVTAIIGVGLYFLDILRAIAGKL